MTSFAITVAYAGVEKYPGAVQKPKALKLITAFVGVIKTAFHFGIFWLEGHPDRSRNLPPLDPRNWWLFRVR
jgi:hypothetical protein